MKAGTTATMSKQRAIVTGSLVVSIVYAIFSVFYIGMGRTVPDNSSHEQTSQDSTMIRHLMDAWKKQELELKKSSKLQQQLLDRLTQLLNKKESQQSEIVPLSSTKQSMPTLSREDLAVTIYPTNFPGTRDGPDRRRPWSILLK